MIFVTAGTQEPFDRLVKAVDKISLKASGTEFIVQALDSKYKTKNINVLNFVSPIEFEAYINEAELIISHAGMGTIISSLVKEKPLLIMPRLVKYREHRNEHQLATAKKMDEFGYVNVAYDETDLESKFF